MRELTSLAGALILYPTYVSRTTTRGWLGSLLDFAPLHRHSLLWREGRRLNRVLNLRNA